MGLLLVVEGVLLGRLVHLPGVHQPLQVYPWMTKANTNKSFDTAQFFDITSSKAV